MKPTTNDVLKWAREADDELIMAGMVGTRGRYAQILSTIAYAAGAAAMKERAAKVCEETKDKSGVNDDGSTWLERATKHDCAKAIRALGDDDD